MLLHFVSGQAPVILSFDCPEDVVSGSQDNHLNIMMENDVTVASMQFYLQFSPGDLIEITDQSAGELTEGFLSTCSHNDGMNEGEYYCLIISPGMGLTVPPSSGSILNIEFSADTVLTEISVSFSEAIISGSAGQDLESDFSDNCSFSVVESEVFLYIGDVNELTGTMEIRMTNIEVVCGFQFYVSGVNLTGAIGISYPYPVNTSPNGFVQGLVMECGNIPPGDGILAILYFDEVTDSLSCLIEPIVADEIGMSLEVEVGDCISITGCIPGDLNADFIVNILDILMAINCVIEATYCPCADMDSSGDLDVLDIVAMVDLILGN